jgi:hypothetical protein
MTAKGNNSKLIQKRQRNVPPLAREKAAPGSALRCFLLNNKKRTIHLLQNRTFLFATNTLHSFLSCTPDFQRGKAHRLGGGFLPLTGAAVSWNFGSSLCITVKDDSEAGTLADAYFFGTAV